MDVVETLDDLLEDLLCIRFFKSSSFADIVQQVTSCTELHDNDDVLLSLNCFVNLDDVIVSHSEEQIDFLHEFMFLYFVCEAFLV